jgi:hypothetical protein
VVRWQASAAAWALVLAAAAGCLSPSSTSKLAPSAPATAARTHPAVGGEHGLEPTLPSLRPLDVGSRVPAPASPRVSGAPAPVRLSIPSIGVDASLVRLDLNSDGTIQVPSDFDAPGWYGRGPAPGDEGPAVILGHLDSRTGPAVFWRLSSLRAGDTISIRRVGGSEVRFRIDRTVTYPVDSFPSFDVYGATSRPELRLVTCGGTYSRSRGQYLSNVVVFASLSS